MFGFITLITCGLGSATPIISVETGCSGIIHDETPTESHCDGIDAHAFGRVTQSGTSVSLLSSAEYAGGGGSFGGGVARAKYVDIFLLSFTGITGSSIVYSPCISVNVSSSGQGAGIAEYLVLFGGLSLSGHSPTGLSSTCDASTQQTITVGTAPTNFRIQLESYASADSTSQGATSSRSTETRFDGI